MIDSMTITTRWNSLFDWRLADISNTGILDFISEPVTCILSANAWGLKGKLPGCKHSWIASFDGAKWKTYEITDLETVDIQQGTVLYAGYTDKMLKQLIVSNRHPGTKWFGNMPKLDYIGKFIDVDATDYPMNYAINLTTNNCNTFVSYIAWKYQIPTDQLRIGHKGNKFWQTFTDK
jgi:hypothetical protein